MPRAAVKPLRDLTEAERPYVAVLVRATSERADVRQRAVALLAVAAGQSYTAAAQRAGYASGDAVSSARRARQPARARCPGTGPRPWP
jgi:DNA-directed RNA polymerase specialized sigma24 family protein